MAALPPAFTKAEALAAGLTPGVLRGPRATRLHHDVYAEAGQRIDVLDRCRALAASVRQDIVASHWTAAAIHGLPSVGRPTPGVHVTVPETAPPVQRSGVVTHRSDLDHHEICVIDGVLVTTPARTFVDHAMHVSLEDLVALGDAVLHTKLATPLEIAGSVVTRLGCRGVRNLRIALPFLDGRAQSVPESLLRVRIILAGLPMAEPQLEVLDHRGALVAQVDLGYEEEMVAIEYEGRHHAEGEQFDYDLDRYTELASLGWHILRPGRRALRAGGRLFLRRLARRLNCELD